MSAGLVRVTSSEWGCVFASYHIPIHDEFGEPVGFVQPGGLRKNEEAVLKQTLETDIYKKEI